MLAAIFWFIVFYLMYKFVFEFVIPLVLATKNVRAKMKDMTQNAGQFDNSQNTDFSKKSFTKNHPDTSRSKGDYIDFEEVK